MLIEIEVCVDVENKENRNQNMANTNIILENICVEEKPSLESVDLKPVSSDERNEEKESKNLNYVNLFDQISNFEITKSEKKDKAEPNLDEGMIVVKKDE